MIGKDHMLTHGSMFVLAQLLVCQGKNVSTDMKLSCRWICWLGIFMGTGTTPTLGCQRPPLPAALVRWSQKARTWRTLTQLTLLLPFAGAVDTCIHSLLEQLHVNDCQLHDKQESFVKLAPAVAYTYAKWHHLSQATFSPQIAPNNDVMACPTACYAQQHCVEYKESTVVDTLQSWV